MLFETGFVDQIIRSKGDSNMLEYLTYPNIITAVVVLIMLLQVKKLFRGDISDNKILSVTLLIVLGIGLYLWKSGIALEILQQFGILQ
jgi:hypothetical protein